MTQNTLKITEEQQRSTEVSLITNESNKTNTMNRRNNRRRDTRLTDGHFGYKVMQMDNEVYQLRRRVINCIHEAKNLVDLPRIDVRIVDGGKPTDAIGYAWHNSNIVHMSKRWCTMSHDELYMVVLHELVHAVVGFHHDENCYLMKATFTDANNIKLAEKRFQTYFK